MKSILTLFCIITVLSASHAAAPTLSISKEGESVALVFTGALEASPSPAGPWNPLTNSSPALVAATERQRYFRARSVEGLSIFSSTSVVEFSLSGPMQQNFDLAHAGMPDGIFPPLRVKEYFDAQIQMGALQRPITLRVRGNSSLQECPFPKMKFKLSRENRAGTPFEDAREIKVGTHCAEGGRGNIGRLRDQIATFREALVYEAMRELGFVTPRVRRALIQYLDTTPASQTPEGGWDITRQALVIEDIEVLGERLGGRALDDEEVAALSNAGFPEQLITDLHLFHALTGNWDYGLSLDGRGLWNTDVLLLPDGKYLPVAGDFDISSWVTGQVRSMAPHDYRPDIAPVAREAAWAIEEIQREVSAESFEAGKARFMQARPALEALLASSLVDDEGRANALAHLAAFFDALQGIKR